MSPTADRAGREFARLHQISFDADANALEALNTCESQRCMSKFITDGEAPTVAKRVLIVEDEALVAMLLEDMLGDAGHAVANTISTLEQALDYIDASADQFDFAILDVNLGGQPIFPVAEALSAKGKTFAFATGYGPGGLPEAWRNRPTLSKPFGANDVSRVIDGHA